MSRLCHNVLVSQQNISSNIPILCIQGESQLVLRFRPNKKKYVYIYLTHLSRMNFPISISRMSPFQILGVLSGIFHFIQILIEHSVSKQWIPWSWSALFAYAPQKGRQASMG